MSLISGLFTLPFGIASAFQAYNCAHFEFSLEQRTIFGSKRISKNDSSYAQLLSTLPGSRIKTAMQPFLDKVGIRKDLIFFERPGNCSATGTNIFVKGDAVVRVSLGFYEADKNACSWVIKHEISHIKHNDVFTISCISSICQLAASIFGICFLSFLPALGITFLGLALAVAIVSPVSLSQWREAKADDFAIANSFDEELKGGRRLFMAMQKMNIEERNTFWKRVSISANGNKRLDMLHPSITSRIQKIEKALRARNIEIDIEAERIKMNNLETYMANKVLLD